MISRKRSSWLLRGAVVCGLACITLAGCAAGGGGGNKAVADKQPEHKKTAPEAWDSMEGNAKGWGIAGTFLGGPARDVGRMLKESQEEAERESDRAMQSDLPVQALDSMIDSVAQTLVTEIPNVPEVKNSKYQLILAFADIASDARGNPQLESALDSLRGKLATNEKMNDNFVFVTTTESNSNKLAQQIGGKDTSAFRDPLQRTANTTNAVVYDPQSIFLITGKMFSSKQPVKHSVTVTLSMQFNHVLSRRTVLDKKFSRTYMWHPDDHNWELQP